MKNIKDFRQFTINESDEPIEAGDTSTSTQDPLVAGKSFFRELHTHAKYWFTYGTLQKIGELEKDEMDSDKISLWVRDKNDDYLWKIIIRIADEISPSDKVEKLKVDLQLYDDTDKLLRSTTTDTETKQMTEITMRRMLYRLRKSVIKVPKTKIDVKRFNKDEGENLTDDIY